MIDKQAADMRREYLQKWRKRNPEKVRKYNRDYWLRKAAMAEKGKQDNESDSE